MALEFGPNPPKIEILEGRWMPTRPREARFVPSTAGARRPGSIRRWLALGCFIAGGTLVVTAVQSRIEGQIQSEAALERFAEAHSRADATPPEVETGAVDFSLWASKRIEKYWLSLGEELELPIARLEIPRLGIVVGVLDGVDELRLDHGVGRIPGTGRPGTGGNLGIAGHRDGFFRGLKDVAVGDELILVRLDGRERYLVDSLAVVSPTEVSVLAPTPEPAVTLVTCFPFYYVGDAPQRFIVRATLARQARETPSGTLGAPEDSTPDPSRAADTGTSRPSVATNRAGSSGSGQERQP